MPFHRANKSSSQVVNNVLNANLSGIEGVGVAGDGNSVFVEAVDFGSVNEAFDFASDSLYSQREIVADSLDFAGSGLRESFYFADDAFTGALDFSRQSQQQSQAVFSEALDSVESTVSRSASDSGARVESALKWMIGGLVLVGALQVFRSG